ncbi:hypothetical protein ABVK25_006033 [Lepraria finkii]|uniref:DUF427 domain-containing protein n=1 Tax=Lepraria finkii TaxID=1340010 RepID=A0ABR4B787_9LECA
MGLNTWTEAVKTVTELKMSSLTKLAQTLLANGPHKLENTSRRVRGLYDSIYVFDTTEALLVWEHPYYPQFYIPSSAVKHDVLTKNEPVDKEGSAFLATLKGKNKSTDRVISFEKGPLAGLVRFEFTALDDWFEEDMPIYVHPKDPYKRIDILPSSRTVTAKVDGVTIAESSNNMFLYETSLRTRQYLPKTAARWEYLKESKTTTACPYKGEANYYNVFVNGKEYKDLIWWYKTPTAESAPIVGHICFYNEKCDIYIDGVKEEK